MHEPYYLPKGSPCQLFHQRESGGLCLQPSRANAVSPGRLACTVGIMVLSQGLAIVGAASPAKLDCKTALSRSVQPSAQAKRALTRATFYPIIAWFLTNGTEYATIPAATIDLDAHPEGWRDRPDETPATSCSLGTGRELWCQFRQGAPAVRNG
jgi:hypothetical protein